MFTHIHMDLRILFSRHKPN